MGSDCHCSSRKYESKQTSTEKLVTSQTEKKCPGKIDDLKSVDFLSSNANSSYKESMFFRFLFVMTKQ